MVGDGLWPIESDFVDKTKRTILADLRTDPALRYILLLSFGLSVFWIWYRVPNFAAPDEYGRLLRPMKAVGYFVADPSINSFILGATDGVPQGASFYLYGLILVPVFTYILLSGNLGSFAGLSSVTSRWTLWHQVPEWFWTSSILLARFVNVLFAVGGVYLTYRIGTALYGRMTGRIASLLFSLSLVSIASAHEANEDTVMVFFLLLSLYLSIRYLRSGAGGYFLAACLSGGLTMAFKLTGGVVVVFIIGALLLRKFHYSDSSGGLSPRLLGLGIVLGLLIFYFGRPNILFLGPQELLARIPVGGTGGGNLEVTSRTEPPFGYYVVFSYLNAVGLPLAIAVSLGTIAALRRSISDRFEEESLILIGIFIYVIVFLLWSKNTGTHHVLPSVPLLELLVAIPAARWVRSERKIKQLMVAFLLLTTAIYAAGGTVQYAMEPRDQGTKWLQENLKSNESIVVYENSVADLAIIHGRPVEHYDFVEERGVHFGVANKSEYTEWMVETPERGPKYIQLTDQSLSYLDPQSMNRYQFPKRASYISRLVAGESGYRIIKTFGREPSDPSYVVRLVKTGLYPNPEKLTETVIILRRE